MILEDSDVEERLNSKDNLVNILTLKRNGSGPVVPLKVAELIGRIQSKTVESAKETAEVFEIDASKVSELRRVEESKNPDITGKAHNDAVDLMVESIGKLRTRIDEVDKPQHLSRIAVDMSRVIQNLKPKESSGETRVLVQVYAPIVKSEKEYETINV